MGIGWYAFQLDAYLQYGLWTKDKFIWIMCVNYSFSVVLVMMSIHSEYIPVETHLDVVRQSELDPTPNIPTFWWSRMLIFHLSLSSMNRPPRCLAIQVQNDGHLQLPS